MIKILLLLLLVTFMAYGCASLTSFPASDGFIGTEMSAISGYMGDQYAERGAQLKNPLGRATEMEPASALPLQTTSRKVHYNAHLKLRATKPEKVMEDAIVTVKAVGGYVEQQSHSLIVFRIPVAKFMNVYNQLQTFGEVINKSITATDITDAYVAVQLRLKLAKTTLQRLQALLIKAQTEKEKLQLLKEIQRVSEEVERLEGQFSTLDSLAKYSQLVLELEARLGLQARNHKQDFRGFGWIYSLSPFEKTVAQGGASLAFDVPEKMVALREEQPWTAESADHVAFWASKRLEDFSDNPYVYMVGIRVVEDKIHLVEIYFPSKVHEQQYWPNIAKVIEKGEQ
jgi:hypothetical protein